MEEIFEPNLKFNFENLTLSPPTSILGGNYFIKFQISGNPLYIQSPKCYTKQGIIKAGKKMYCDLLMSNDHEQFIQWMENLENYSQEYIFKNREKWFETDLEKHDIENSFLSPVKTYKSGKFYTTRTNIPICLGKSSLKIYDENEQDVNIELIKDNTNIIAIMEVQGIKCSARSFQIEIELKQIMVLKPKNLFEKCIIKSSQSIDTLTQPVSTQLSNVPFNLDENITYTLSPENLIKLDSSKSVNDTKINNDLESNNLESNNLESNDLESNDLESNDLESNGEDDIFAHNNFNSIKNSSNLTEVEFTLDELPENDVIQLKKRNDVYYQMYKEAKKKAKIAKNLALSTYLDAKRIKNTYMLDEIDDDSDLDSNFDDENNDEDNKNNE